MSAAQALKATRAASIQLGIDGDDLPPRATLPFGTEPGIHAWLHSECWRPWSDARRADALKAKRCVGILLDTVPGWQP